LKNNKKTEIEVKLREFIKSFYCEKCKKDFDSITGNCPWCFCPCLAKIESWD